MLSIQLTGDGTYTFYSDTFQELFHSHSGARQEAQYKFVEPCQIVEKARTRSRLTLLDICYGLGYNSAAALEAIWSANPDCQVELIALEWDASVPQQALDRQLLDGWSDRVLDSLWAIADSHCLDSLHLRAELLVGDARQTILTLDPNWKADAIFLDPFSPNRCPQLWSVEFLAGVARHLKPDGRLATYSCAAAVRKALQLAGLQIGSTPGVGRRSPGTLASFEGNDLPPLSLQEREHLATRAAVPYRDPALSDSASCLHQRRERDRASSDLEPSSQWKKRWQQPFANAAPTNSQRDRFARTSTVKTIAE